MTTNLALGKNTTLALTSAKSNVSSSGYTLPVSSTSTFTNQSYKEGMYNSNSTTCGSNSPCYAYYTQVTACTGERGTRSSSACSYDICPAGWRLPKTTEFTELTNTYSSVSALMASPFKAVKVGYYSGTSLFGGGNAGVYWSGNMYNYLEGSRLYFYGNILPTTVSNQYIRVQGFSVRCIMK